MDLIALEEHVLPTQFAEQIWTDNLPQVVVGSPALREQLDDIEQKRLPAMDAAGVDMQVLSSVAPAAQAEAPGASVRLAADFNDYLASVKAAHPTRFQGLACLPTPDPAAAAREARRAVEELGLCGVMVQGHTEGRFLDAPEFDPILTAVEELGVPLYLHPTFPPKQVAEVYYAGLPDAAAGQLATAAWGWHAETGLHVLRLVVGGVFERHPGLQVIVGHMGENLPFSLMRADAMLAGTFSGDRSVAEIVRQHVHITICGYATLPPFECALAVFGPDRILFSVDYPWGDPTEFARFLGDAPIPPDAREKIAHRNAERLFRLGGA